MQPPPTGSSSKPAYLVSQVDTPTTAILSVGDSVNLGPDGVTPYRMAGIPDGLGAYDNGDGTFTVLMNHELGATVGAVRAHGAKGAFVSKWIVDADTLEVLHGEDLIQQVVTHDTATGTWNAPAKGVVLNRLCSADLPAPSALFDAASGLGTTERLFLSGEEAGAEGRVFAHVATGATAGTSYELPRLGKFSWENALANPGTGASTVVAGTDDSTPGQVYLYKGTKTTDANPVVAAGLTNGTLGGISVAGLAAESDANVISSPTTFTVADLGDVSGRTGAQLEADSTAAGATKFARPEDGAWDPARPNDFYFVTTASFGRKDDPATPASEYTAGLSRLWRLRFVDAANPSLGGTAEVLYESPAYDPALTDADQSGPRMMDNLTVNKGEVIIQEDPGNNAYLAGIWQYDIARDTMRRVYAHDAALFAPGSPGFITQDEESSGIIPASDLLGGRTYLAVSQVHKASADPELVEDGQLMAVRIPPAP